jgi:hypothetical protein
MRASKILHKRASVAELRNAAADLNYSLGTDARGKMIPLGSWEWEGTFDPQPLPPNPSPRERMDMASASGLVSAGYPERVFDAFMAARLAITEATDGESQLLADGYQKKALLEALPIVADRVRKTLGDHAQRAERVANRIGEVFADLSGRRLYDGAADLDEDDTVTTKRAISDAIYDTAILQNLKLTPADEAIIDHGALPKQLDDLRVLSAVFNAPAALSPFTPEQRAKISRLAFRKAWPRTAHVVETLHEQLQETQRVLGWAVAAYARQRFADDPKRGIRDIPGGAWAVGDGVNDPTSPLSVFMAEDRDGVPRDQTAWAAVFSGA